MLRCWFRWKNWLWREVKLDKTDPKLDEEKIKEIEVDKSEKDLLFQKVKKS